MKSESWSFCPETCAASGFAALEPEGADGIIVANNPINFIDPTGEKVRYCVVGLHGYLGVDGQTWGFYPNSVINAAFYGSVPGLVKYNVDHGGICFYSKDDCSDNCVINAANASMANPPRYDLFGYNCHAWASDILKQCNVK